MKSLSLLLSLLCCSVRAAAPDPWSELTRRDVDAAYALIKENHPGSLDDNNPKFRVWLEEGHRAALVRAGRALSYGGWYFTLKGFLTGFKDGHLGFYSTLTQDAVLWPGFIMALREKRYVVHSAAPGSAGFSALPAPGAVLVSCDGKTPEMLLKENVFPFWGDEALGSSWIGAAPMLLLDRGNPFIKRPEKCAFDTGGTRRELVLDWKTTGDAEIGAALRAAGFGSKPALGVRPFGKDAFWVSLPSFAPEGEELAAMKEVIAKAKDLRKASVIVFDLRGNGGGNSEWGNEIMDNLYGKAYARRLSEPSGSETVDWRVSEGNLQYVRAACAGLLAEFGADSEVYRGFREAEKGMAQSLKQGRAYYREVREPARPQDVTDDASGGGPVSGKVFFLTDGRCASACLDFADGMLSEPGVIHIGQATLADTDYMDVRGVELPSGIGRLSVAMKVHRNRRRLSGQAYVPRYVWEKDIWDTEGLETWVLSLVGL